MAHAPQESISVALAHQESIVPPEVAAAAVLRLCESWDARSLRSAAALLWQLGRMQEARQRALQALSADISEDTEEGRAKTAELLRRLEDPAEAATNEELFEGLFRSWNPQLSDFEDLDEYHDSYYPDCDAEEDGYAPVCPFEELSLKDVTQ